ncbi:MAG: sulfate ABC transporter permease subunit CysT [Planctomycetes bacterium]|nr:sulfate ABC transporter permease subunit CysT [Planctomycetota bacterium]
MRAKRSKTKSLPGFGITFGFTLFYLALIVLIPMAALFWKSLSMDFKEFLATLANPRVQASFRLTFGASLVAAVVNLIFGAIAAWSLTRYQFPGKGLLNALVDLPFAMPTAVSGIALMTIFSPTGLLGSWLFPLGIKTSISPLGVVIALVFIGFPFVVRTLQPAIEDLDREAEMAAASLGASRWQTFYRVTVPSLLPAAVTGFTLAFARALGEYGSVVFIAGNLPMKTEIASLLIISRIDENDIAGASAVAMVLLVLTLVILLLIQGVQWLANRRTGRETG